MGAGAGAGARVEMGGRSNVRVAMNKKLNVARDSDGLCLLSYAIEDISFSHFSYLLSEMCCATCHRSEKFSGSRLRPVARVFSQSTSFEGHST